MPAHKKTEGRVLGPYEVKWDGVDAKGKKVPVLWRVIVVHPDGSRKARNYPSLAAAKAYRGFTLGGQEAQKRLSVDKAILFYNERKLKGAGQKASAWETTVRRLRLFFKPVLKQPMPC